jgi:hypothetical protein
MNRSYRGLPLAASLTATACAPGDPLPPDGALPTSIHLTTDVRTSLASLGDTALVRPRVLDPHGAPLEGVPLRWSARPSGIVQLDGEGVYRAIGNGRVQVVAEIDPGKTGVRPAGYWAAPIADSVSIEVRQRPARLTLASVDTAFGTLGASRQLHAQVTDARGHAMLDGPPRLTWLSADPRVLVVDGSGIVRSLGEGTARVLVQADQLSGAATFTVTPRLPHTSCMVFAQRRQTRQSCVTLDLTVREGGR